MNYEKITVENPMDKTTQEHIVITREDGSFESFPVDETNPRYIQFQTDLANQQSTSKAGK